jgi:hypothetical protein
MMRGQGPISPLSAAQAGVDTARGTKEFDQQTKSGELPIKRQATWGVSVLSVFRMGTGTLDGSDDVTVSFVDPRRPTLAH